MHSFHAHLYFTLEERGLAEKVRNAIAYAIPGCTYVGNLIPMPIGPHPKPMLEIHIPGHLMESALPQLDILRAGLSVLIHPVQQDELEAHTIKAIWLGTPLKLNLDIFRE